jgi:hypothetical protein
LRAALAVSDRIEEHGQEFAGAWVLDELERQLERPCWLPNLRILVSYGLIEKSGESTRGGKRAWYRFTAKDLVREALASVGPQTDGDDGAAPDRRKFRFIGAGDSRQPGSDYARRSGDLDFEPPAWR